MPSQTKTNRVRGAHRGKSDPRMAIVKWARENGAVHIKIDGIEVVFPPTYAPAVQQPHLTPEQVVARAQGPNLGADQPGALTSVHPDEYAEQSDLWASFQPIRKAGT